MALSAHPVPFGILVLSSTTSPYPEPLPTCSPPNIPLILSTRKYTTLSRFNRALIGGSVMLYATGCLYLTSFAENTFGLRASEEELGRLRDGLPKIRVVERGWYAREQKSVEVGDLERARGIGEGA